MLLSALRGFESGKVTVPVFICEDVDFDSAMALVNVYLEHTFIMYHGLPKADKLSKDVSPVRTKFYDCLPSEFEKKQADEIGKSQKIPERTVTAYLKYYCTMKLLDKPGYGKYQKLIKT
jgi:hypothetical protein